MMVKKKILKEWLTF